MSLAALASLVLVGAGKMGTALAKGWLAGGLPPDRLILVNPRPGEATRAFAGEHGIRLVDAAPPEPAGVLVLGVKPQVMAAVMATLGSSVDRETLVLSIAAGIGIQQIAEALGTRRVVRTMPNTPARVGKGMSGAVPDSGVTAEDRETVEALMRACGDFVWFTEETKLDVLTAVSGSGPAYVFHMVEALALAGQRQGLEAATAMRLARQTIIGAAALIEADSAPATTLRENVTSPKGTTAAALAVLMGDGGLVPLIDRAVDAARRRSEELGRA